MTIDQLLTAIFTNGIGVVCAAAVLWFAFYRETKTIPQMMATFSASLTKFAETVETMQKGFSERNQQTMQTFTSIMREERSTCERWHTENRQAHGETRDRMDALAGEIKENRHGIRDIVNQLSLRGAVEEERTRQATEKGRKAGGPQP